VYFSRAWGGYLKEVRVRFAGVALILAALSGVL
jgi:hypothetical protein